MTERHPGVGGSALTVSQMADSLGISSYTLRYYEAEGLVIPQRTTGGQRRYLPEDADWLRELIELRDAGMSLDQLRSYALAHDERTAPAQRLELLLAHEAQLRAHLATLRRHLRATEKHIARHHTDIDEPPRERWLMRRTRAASQRAAPPAPRRDTR